MVSISMPAQRTSLNCSVNSPFDDGICPKSSFALGYARATENVTITNCQVSGYDEGNISKRYLQARVQQIQHNSPTGESSLARSRCGFKNITISNCVFDYSRGFCAGKRRWWPAGRRDITNVTMRRHYKLAVLSSFRKPCERTKETTTVGRLRRVLISNMLFTTPTRSIINHQWHTRTPD